VAPAALRPGGARAGLVAGGLIVGGFALAALLAPFLSNLIGQDPFEQVLPKALIPPTPPDAEHLLGTDNLGRDLLSRLIHGARISLLVGVLAEAIALLIGTAVGATAGLAAGGRLDAFLMRTTDLIFAFPAPLMALAVIATVPEPENVPVLRLLPQPSVAVMFLVLGCLRWSGFARLVRAQVMRARALEFARAAEALGARAARIALRHLLPHSAGPLIAAVTLGIGSNILMEAWLSFLGVGARPPLPSWGTMITEGQSYILSKPWVSMAPGAAILIVVLGFNLLGDALGARFEPHRQNAP
jgi:ABC-type dipeptide/oligopeptide/nickel transport system permease subunit